MRVVIRHMAKQLMESYEEPGKAKATYQWCAKFVAMYPQCGEIGETMGQKTVIGF